MKSTFYEQNKRLALDMLEGASSTLKSKIFDIKYSLKHSVLPQVSSIPSKIKNFKFPIKAITTTNKAFLNDKIYFKEERNYKTEEINKETYFSDLSGISLNISTDNISSLKEKKINLFSKSLICI